MKRYLAPATPAARLIAAESIAADIKARLTNLSESLDPLRLLDEIRAIQHHLAALAKGERVHAPAARSEDLTEFLASLALAWKASEVRPTHAPKPRPNRIWRSRKDPFEEVCSEIAEWLDAEPDQLGVGRHSETRWRNQIVVDQLGVELLARLQKAYPGRFPDGQLRTLQRRLADWQLAAASRLVFRDLHTHPPVQPPTRWREGTTGTSQSRGACPLPPHIPPSTNNRIPQ